MKKGFIGRPQSMSCDVHSDSMAHYGPLWPIYKLPLAPILTNIFWRQLNLEPFDTTPRLLITSWFFISCFTFQACNLCYQDRVTFREIRFFLGASVTRYNKLQTNMPNFDDSPKIIHNPKLFQDDNQNMSPVKKKKNNTSSKV